MAQADRAVIDKWLVMLVTATASGGMALSDLEAKVTLYGDLLASEFDAGAFTRRSLQDVAGQCKFFPAYGELVPLLRAWWRENRPTAAPALAGPSTRHLSTEDRQWLAFWQRREAENFAATSTHPATSRGNVLSLIRQQSPRAYAAITAEAEPQRRGPTAEEAQAVARSVQQALRAMHDAAHGPDSATPDSQPQREPPLPDVTHKGELLRQRREARGIVVPFVAKPPEVADDAQPAPETIPHEAAE